MPTRREMQDAILRYCCNRACNNCVIEHAPWHITGECYECDDDVLRSNYNLVMQATDKLIQKSNESKGEDIMIITETEKQELLSNMKKLLEEYNYRYTTHALDDIIDTWAQNKSDLITAFKKHPNYVEGKFMIAFDKDYERVTDMKAIINFSEWLAGYPIRDLCHDVPTEIREKTLLDECKYLPEDLYDFLTNLSAITTREVSVETAEKINQMVPEVHAHAGQKTTRVINKLCTYLGYNKHPNYNRAYAQYADALSPLTIRRHTVLSLNPLDYLTMSFGNSWASCHTIDKENKRDMPDNYSGCYSSGTISYMLDPSSMVFYTVDASASGRDLWDEPKINRQMFHYGEDKLVQGRLYPQSNDSTGQDLYDSYRQIVQEIMSTILEQPNLWTLRKRTGSIRPYVYSDGTQYCDYFHYDSCTLSLFKNTENENRIYIGHAPICIECGGEHSTEESINCCHSQCVRCADCGEYINNEDDEYRVDGEVYCRNCVSYCESCQEYHRTDNHYIAANDIYVCDDCYDNYYAACGNCGTIYHMDDLDENCLCSDCAEELATEDEEAC